VDGHCSFTSATVYRQDVGHYADFHSLRHTTRNLPAASGVHPKIAQEIMRHSDINVTMNHYTHTLRGQETEAIHKLPDYDFRRKGKRRSRYRKRRFHTRPKGLEPSTFRSTARIYRL
jgi:hypothetical protein